MSVCRSKEWGFESSYTHLLLALATSSDTGVHNAPHVGRVVRTIFLLRFLEIGHRIEPPRFYVHTDATTQPDMTLVHTTDNLQCLKISPMMFNMFHMF